MDVDGCVKSETLDDKNNLNCDNKKICDDTTDMCNMDNVKLRLINDISCNAEVNGISNTKIEHCQSESNVEREDIKTGDCDLGENICLYDNLKNEIVERTSDTNSEAETKEDAKVISEPSFDSVNGSGYLENKENLHDCSAYDAGQMDKENISEKGVSEDGKGNTVAIVDELEIKFNDAENNDPIVTEESMENGVGIESEVPASFDDKYEGKTCQLANFAVVYSFLNMFGVFLDLPVVSLLDLEQSIDSTKELGGKDEQGILEILHLKLFRKLNKSPRLSSVGNCHIDRLSRSITKFAQVMELDFAWDLQQFGYHILSSAQRLTLLKHLCEVQFDENARFRNDLMEAYKADQSILRLAPFGYEQEGLNVWLHEDNDLNIHIYAGEDHDHTGGTWKLRVGCLEDMEWYISKLKKQTEINPKDIAVEEIKKRRIFRQLERERKKKEKEERRKEEEAKRAMKKGRGKNKRKKEATPVETPTSDEEEDDGCAHCYENRQTDVMLLCDGCDAAYHTLCLRPPVVVIPDDDWYCPFCSQIQLIQKLEQKFTEIKGKIKAKERKSRRLDFYGIRTTNIVEQPSDGRRIGRAAARRVDYNFTDYDQLISEAVSGGKKVAMTHSDKESGSVRESSRSSSRRKRKLNTLSSDEYEDTADSEYVNSSSDEAKSKYNMKNFVIDDDIDEIEDRRDSFLRRSSRNKVNQRQARKRHRFDDDSDYNEYSDGVSERPRMRLRQRNVAIYSEQFSDDDDIVIKDVDDGGDWEKELEKEQEEIEESDDNYSSSGESIPVVKTRQRSLRVRPKKRVFSDDDSGEEVPYDDESEEEYESEFEEEEVEEKDEESDDENEVDEVGADKGKDGDEIGLNDKEAEKGIDDGSNVSAGGKRDETEIDDRKESMKFLENEERRSTDDEEKEKIVNEEQVVIENEGSVEVEAAKDEYPMEAGKVECVAHNDNAIIVNRELEGEFDLEDRYSSLRVKNKEGHDILSDIPEKNTLPTSFEKVRSDTNKSPCSRDNDKDIKISSPLSMLSHLEQANKITPPFYEQADGKQNVYSADRNAKIITESNLRGVSRDKHHINGPEGEVNVFEHDSVRNFTSEQYSHSPIKQLENDLSSNKRLPRNTKAGEDDSYLEVESNKNERIICSDQDFKPNLDNTPLSAFSSKEKLSKSLVGSRSFYQSVQPLNSCIRSDVLCEPHDHGRHNEPPIVEGRSYLPKSDSVREMMNSPKYPVNRKSETSIQQNWNNPIGSAHRHHLPMHTDLLTSENYKVSPSHSQVSTSSPYSRPPPAYKPSEYSVHTPKIPLTPSVPMHPSARLKSPVAAPLHPKSRLQSVVPSASHLSPRPHSPRVGPIHPQMKLRAAAPTPVRPTPSYPYSAVQTQRGPHPSYSPKDWTEVKNNPYEYYQGLHRPQAMQKSQFYGRQNEWVRPPTETYPPDWEQLQRTMTKVPTNSLTSESLRESSLQVPEGYSEGREKSNYNKEYKEHMKQLKEHAKQEKEMKKLQKWREKELKKQSRKGFSPKPTPENNPTRNMVAFKNMVITASGDGDEERNVSGSFSAFTSTRM